VPIAVFVAAVATYIVVAIQDLQQRRVSNILCAAIFCLGIVRWAALMQIGPVAWAAAACIALFGLGVLFFSLGWLGGGDVKLISATGFLLGTLDDIVLFLFVMSIVGSALALILLVQKYAGRLFGRVVPSADSDSSPNDSNDHAKVPYAVAVAIAAAIVSFIQIQRA
jgi:prepilin peptidase CpaA